MKSASLRQNHATGFGFLVIHGFSFRGFTLTLRPRGTWVSPPPKFASFRLFRRLRAIELPQFHVQEPGASSLNLFFSVAPPDEKLP
jgi:hypothetical protein